MLSLFVRVQYDQKNIRRRVYDALNVLMAMDIIEKKKKDIRWIGLPTNAAQEHLQLQVWIGAVPLASSCGSRSAGGLIRVHAATRNGLRIGGNWHVCEFAGRQEEGGGADHREAHQGARAHSPGL
jgi:hypothetical protein